jgi:hypothetical protein
MTTLKRKVEDEIDSNQEDIPERDIHLPKKVKNIKEDEVADEDENICCICLDTIKETNNVKTICNHNFCFSCLLEHLKTKNTCPCCRVPIESIRKNNDLKQITMLEASNLIALNIEQSEMYIKHKIDKIKNHLVFSLFMNDTNTINVDTAFQRELLTITNSEIFNKTIKYFLLNELLGLSAHLSMNNINNMVEWLNQ